MAQKKIRASWWQGILAVNVFLLLITLGKYYLPSFPQDWRIIPPFNLAQEMNLASWWSGLLLFIPAALAYELFSIRSDRSARAWLALSVVLAILSWDEIGAIHERVTTLVDLPLGFILLGILAVSSMHLLRNRDTRTSAVLIFSGVVVFCFVSFQEYLEFALAWPSWLEGIRVAVEEGTELLASSLIIYALVLQRRQYPLDSWRVMVPVPQRFRRFQIILLLGAGINVLISLILVPQMNDLDLRGNPAAWYVTVVYFLLFSAAFWEAVNSPPARKKIWQTMSVVFLLCSAGVIYNLSSLIPGIARVCPQPLLKCYFFLYLSQWVILACLVFSGRILWSPEHTTYAVVILTSAFAGFLCPGQDVQLFVLTVVTYLVARIFFSQYRTLEE